VLREEHRYSQAEVAEKLGISQSYYAKFELDKGEPNLETLVKIGDLYGVNLDYLLGREFRDAAELRREEWDFMMQRLEDLHAKYDNIENRTKKLEAP
jgi:transcriptional regulator with XRE-family HTH domain